MITASQILEEYFTLFEKIPIFTNPNRADLREMGSEIRFIAVAREKTVYCWDANLAIHDPVSRFLGLKFSTQVFWGIAEKQGSKYSVSNSDTAHLYAKPLKIPRSSSASSLGDVSHALEFLGQDWTWLDKYFETTPFILAIASTWGTND
jgi:hypothetical protein